MQHTRRLRTLVPCACVTAAASRPTAEAARTQGVRKSRAKVATSNIQRQSAEAHLSVVTTTNVSVLGVLALRNLSSAALTFLMPSSTAASIPANCRRKGSLITLIYGAEYHAGDSVGLPRVFLCKIRHIYICNVYLTGSHGKRALTNGLPGMQAIERMVARAPLWRRVHRSHALPRERRDWWNSDLRLPRQLCCSLHRISGWSHSENHKPALSA